MELVLDLAKSINDALFGPLGIYYWSQRKDDILSYIVIIIIEYIFPVKRRIEQFNELKMQKEFSNSEEEKLVDLVYQVKNNFKDILHYILFPVISLKGKIYTFIYRSLKFEI